MEGDRGEKGKSGQRVGYIKETEEEKREHIGLRGGVHDMVKHCEHVGKHRDFMKRRDRQKKGTIKSAEGNSVGLVHRIHLRLFGVF